jgi:AbrB family looped-hinge helix DNA binding protein
MARSKLTSKGQVTIPKEIRDYLKVNAGDEVYFYINNIGRVVLRAKTGDITDLRGILKDRIPKRRRPLTIEEMDEAILREHARKR